jgi:hypothetical protein
MRIELAIACTGSAQNLVSAQVIRLSARCDVSFPKGYETQYLVLELGDDSVGMQRWTTNSCRPSLEEALTARRQVCGLRAITSERVRRGTS